MLQGGRQLQEPRLPRVQPLPEQTGAAPAHGALRQLPPGLQDLGRRDEREQPAHDAAQRLRLRLQREGPQGPRGEGAGPRGREGRAAGRGPWCSLGRGAPVWSPGAVPGWGRRVLGAGSSASRCPWRAGRRSRSRRVRVGGQAGLQEAACGTEASPPAAVGGVAPRRGSACVWVRSRPGPVVFQSLLSIRQDDKVVCPRTKEVFHFSQAEKVYIM